VPSQTRGMNATELVGSLRAPGPPSPTRYLRARDDGARQPTTTVELFFDLVYVFAVTQLSHLILGDLSSDSMTLRLSCFATYGGKAAA
jgi:hypothetical protein